MAPTLDSSCTTPTVILWIMRLDTLGLVALGAMALLSSGCGDSEGLRPVLESEVPTTTTKPIVVYSEEGDGPKYVDMYFEAERKWPNLTPNQWAEAATFMVEGGRWDQATVFMGPITTND